MSQPRGLILELRRYCDEAFQTFISDTKKTRRQTLSQKPPKVKITRSDTSVKLSLHGLSVSVNALHFSKLRLSHSNFRPPHAFSYDTFTLLARYDALGGSGFQAAVPGAVLDAMRDVADVRMEVRFSQLRNAQLPI